VGIARKVADAPVVAPRLPSFLLHSVSEDMPFPPWAYCGTLRFSCLVCSG
jgi:hypothetical protein